MTTGGAIPPEPPPSEQGGRLDSWKEIAAHFQRDVRTVRRWEAAEGLPVRRHRHRERDSVYAYASELDAWWSNRRRPDSRPTGSSLPQPAARRYPRARRVLAGAAVLVAGSALFTGLRILAPRTVEQVADARVKRDPTARTAPIDAEANDLYLRARYHLEKRTGQLALARRYLEAAVTRAPDFAPAHAALADALTRVARSRPDEEPDAWARAEASAKRALALDGRLAVAHAVMATIALFRDWDWQRAEAGFQRAVELDARDLEARNGYAIYLRAAGRMDDAIAQRQRALAADPVNVTFITRLGEDYVFARRFDEGIREFRKALELERDYRAALDGLADACARKGLEQEFAVHTTRLLTLRGSRADAAAFERVFRSEGYRAAQRWLDLRNLERYGGEPSINAWNLAFTYARLGDKEKAFGCLEEALARRDPGMLLLRVDPDVDSLRSDPRFDALLRRLGPNVPAQVSNGAPRR